MYDIARVTGILAVAILSKIAARWYVCELLDITMEDIKGRIGGLDIARVT